MPTALKTREFPNPALLPLLAAHAATDWQVECLTKPEQLQPYATELELLRVRSRSAAHVIPLPAWLATRSTAPGWALRTILLRLGGRIEAAVFLLEKTVLGVPTGYFRGGDALGEPLILCAAEREPEFRALVPQLLLRSHRAFLVLLDEPKGVAPIATAPGLSVRRHDDTLHWQHELSATFDETLAGFGRRTRRNLRHSLRRVERNGWQFLPELSARQLIAAVSHLSTHSTHPFSPQLKAQRLRMAAEMDDSFAMGLADADGRWLSCVIGRRIDGATEVFWQPNAAGAGADSLCTTMRALLMQEEVRRNETPGNEMQTRQVRYIGGTCALMQHCCTPTPSNQTSLARGGVRLRVLKAVLRSPWAKGESPLRRHL